MRLSDLQQYILKRTFVHGPKCDRADYLKFYPKSGEHEVKIITKSLDRLIAKSLIVGYGHKTAEKYFIEKVTLTPKGRKLAKRIAADQQRLPLPRRRKPA